MKNKVLLCLFLVTFCEVSLLAADTIRFVNSEYHARFKGELWQVAENDSIYKGVLVDSTLEEQHGLFTKDLSVQSYVSHYSNLIKTVTIDGGRNFQVMRWDDQYTQKDHELTNRYKKLYDNAFVGCYYLPNDDYWFMGTKYDDKRYGLVKNNKSFSIAGSDNWNDFDLKYTFYGPFIWAFWALFFYDLIIVLFKKRKVLISFLSSLIPTILMYIVIPHDVLCYQFFAPLILFFVLWFLSRKNKHVRNLVKSIAYAVLMLCVIFNNFILKESVKIGSEEVLVKWKAGTDILKRYIITNELEKLQEVTVDIQRGGKYPLYVGKEVLTDGMFDAVIGAPLWWISCLQGKLNEQITYREYIYFLERLKDITGLDNFDLLRYDELKDLNDKDSVLLEKEFNELTSTYKICFQTIDENRIIPMYDNIVYVDSSCVDTNGKLSDNYCYKYKNAVIYDATARLVMRKKEGRHFEIMGIKIDPTNENLPDSIMLLSINRKPLEKQCYEKFEELEVEDFYKNRTIEFVTNYVELPKKLYQHAGRTDYWYIPIFSYNSILD